MGRPTSSSMRSRALRVARTCLRVTAMPPTPSGVPSSRPSMWLCPAVRMTIMWSAPCQAAMRMRRMSSSKRPGGDLGGHDAVGLRVDVVEVVGRRQRDAVGQALRRLLVLELEELLVGHLLAPVPALAARPVVLDAVEQPGDVELLVGVERQDAGRRRRRCGLAHAAPPHRASTVSQPSPAARRRAASGTAHVPGRCCSAARPGRRRAPAGRASRTRRRRPCRCASRCPCASAPSARWTARCACAPAPRAGRRSAA